VDEHLFSNVHDTGQFFLHALTSFAVSS